MASRLPANSSSAASPTRQLSRLAPDGRWAVAERGRPFRWLLSDPFSVAPADWQLGEPCPAGAARLAPATPRQVLGIGRNYAEHAAELGNPRPEEPLLFLKSPSSVIGPDEAVVLPAESSEVHFEGEIALVLRRRVRRATADEALDAVLGVTAACDVTARDLQRKDRTFTRGKSFDTFCPLGPAIAVHPPWPELWVATRVNGQERQRGRADEMLWGFADLLAYGSRFLTLEAGDVVLTGTPAGVGPLAAGDTLEVEVSGVGTLRSPVVAANQ